MAKKIGTDHSWLQIIMMEAGFVASVWVGRFSGCLSLFGSSLIIYMILSRQKTKLTRPKNRFMLMMSLFDVLHSLVFITGTLAVPQESGISGAMGNPSTCVVQGFIATMGLSVPLYNNSLNLFYLLTIKHEMSVKDFAKCLEPLCHAVSILVPLISAIIFACLKWIDVEPDTGTVCYPNDNAIIFAGITLLFTFIFLVYALASICCAVSFQSRRMDRYKFNRTEADDSMKKETTIQAALYATAFIITYMFPAFEITIVLIGSPVSPVSIRILTSAFYPLQGFWNCLFYIRPGVTYLRKGSPDKSFVCAVWEIISNSGSIPNNAGNRLLTRNGRRRASCICTEGQKRDDSSVSNVDHNSQAMINIELLVNDETSPDSNEDTSEVLNKMRKRDKKFKAQNTFNANSCTIKKDELNAQGRCEPTNKIVSDEILRFPRSPRRSMKVRRLSLVFLASVQSDIIYDGS